MAEFAVFSLASKVMSAVASPALTAAYEKGCSIWDAKDDLHKLRVTIETIRVVLLDAEKKQEGSAAVRNWIKRVKDVMYDADDLFDDVATDDMLKRQIKAGNKHSKKVRVYFSKLNPVLSNNSVANRVKAIRKTLLELSIDMEGLGFVQSLSDQPISSIRQLQDPGCFVDSCDVIGRDEDKKAILEMLAYDAEKDVSVIAVVGIGGMGKSTLAQLVYNDEEVQRAFAERWFACISDTADNKEIVEKIFQCICKKKPTLNVGELQTDIRSSIKGNKFLLVLDDVWDDNSGNWMDRLSLLGCGAKGSKIIVTTRNLSVARAMGASTTTTHNLDGLHEDDSWKLFKRIAFTPEQEKDIRRSDLGRKIMKKCANLPLAIKSIGSLLRIKSTIEEWESISKEKFLRIGQNDPNSILSILRFSYDHLNSNLKQCFAYCSLFPKDHVIYKWDLIYLWMAQGYIQADNETHTAEEIGHSYFMDLVRRSFFQEMGEDDLGEHCKMHDLIHDLAQQVAGEEIVMLTARSSYGVNVARHVSVGDDIDDSWEFAPVMIRNGHQLRSFLYFKEFEVGRLILGEELRNGKYLRSLSLRGVGIENIPTSVGELKHLRYLDISDNRFKSLPDSLTKLVNLCTLNITSCEDLEVLPNDFRKLINLRHLKNKRCLRLKYMSPGFEELASLQRLDEFTARGGGSKVQVLEGHRVLSGELCIYFGLDDTNNDWDEVECWLPPMNLQRLKILDYNGTRIPKWGSGSVDIQLPSLRGLELLRCSRVKHLPPFKHLPNLKFLVLEYMNQLKYIQEDDRATESDSLFLPPLEKLKLDFVPDLEGWWGKVGAANMDESECMEGGHLLHSFTSLSCLEITWCLKLRWMPLCPCLVRLKLNSVDTKLISQLLLPPSLSITTSSSLKYLRLGFCDYLTSLPGESLTSLSTLVIGWCLNLVDVVLAPSRFNLLENLKIDNCHSLELWDEEKRGVDWDSLPNLHTLNLNKVPSPEMLPKCLRDRQV